MALADILQVIVSQKEKEISEMKSRQEEEEKKLLEESENKGKEYSKKRFDDFEKLKDLEEKKLTSDLSRLERMETSRVQNEIMEKIYSELEKKLQSLSKEELTSFCATLIRSISEEKGTIVSKGTDDSILKESIKLAEKTFSIEKGDGTGGFEFVGDGYSVDFSFHSLVHSNLREKYEADLFKELF